MQTGLAAFRFALVGFTLPFMFVYRPELLLLAPAGGDLVIMKVVLAVLAAVIGIVALAAALAGFFFAPLTVSLRITLFVAAAFALFPGQAGSQIPIFDIIGAAILIGVGFINNKQSGVPPVTESPVG